MNVEVVDQARTRELRRAVLRPHLSLSGVLPGDGIPDAVHLAALDGDQTVGACFVYPARCPWRPDEPGWRLRSMATEPARQRTGVGSAVLTGAVEYVAERGGGILWLHARDAAVPFYARHGLVQHGEPYVENGLPHRSMWRRIENLSAGSPRPS